MNCQGSICQFDAAPEKTGTTDGLALDEELLVAEERAVNRFRSVELEATLSLLKDHRERLGARLAVSLQGDPKASGQRVGGGFADGNLQ